MNYNSRIEENVELHFLPSPVSHPSAGGGNNLASNKAAIESLNGKSSLFRPIFGLAVAFSILSFLGGYFKPSGLNSLETAGMNWCYA